MTVKELKQQVERIPECQNDWIVVLSSDEEGNSFKNLEDIIFDDGLKCSQYFDEPSSVLYSYNNEDFDDYDEFVESLSYHPHLKPCIVLWP